MKGFIKRIKCLFFGHKRKETVTHFGPAFNMDSEWITFYGDYDHCERCHVLLLPEGMIQISENNNKMEGLI